jgi:plasmid stability protein
MASITIRNLDDEVKKQLRKQAAKNGRSLEAEARDILSRNLRAAAPPKRDPNGPKTGLDLVRPILEAVEKYGGVELEIPSRKTSLATEMFEDVAAFQHAPPPKPRRKRRK